MPFFICVHIFVLTEWREMRGRKKATPNQFSLTIHTHCTALLSVCIVFHFQRNNLTKREMRIEKKIKPKDQSMNSAHAAVAHIIHMAIKGKRRAKYFLD